MSSEIAETVISPRARDHGPIEYAPSDQKKWKPWLEAEVEAVQLWYTRGPNHGVAHWQTSLCFSGLVHQKRAITLNMTRFDQHRYYRASQALRLNPYGTLCISAREDTQSKTAKSPIRINIIHPIRNGEPQVLRVADVIKYIEETGQSHYAFNPDQSGCLYWQLSILQALETQGYLHPGKVDSIRSEIEDHRKEEHVADYIPWPPVQGWYYRVVDREGGKVAIIPVRT